MLRIARDYPSTATAAKLAQTDERLGAYAISELGKTIVPKMREKALIFSVEKGKVEAVRNLLGKEVDPNPNVKNSGGYWRCRTDEYDINRTALHIAAARGNAEIVNQLINAGANVNTVREFEADSGGEYTPLTEAAAAGHAEVVKLLLDAGADANSKAANSYYCLTALGHALAGGHKDIVEMLLAAGTDLNYQLSDYGKPGFVPDNCIPSATFVAAAKGGFTDIVERMLDRGAPVNDARAGYAENALMAAAESGHVETVALLVKAGADIDVYNTSEDPTALLTPLGIALKNGHAEVVDFLRKAGAKKVKLEDYGTTKWIMIDETKAVSALIQALRDSQARTDIFRNLKERLDRYRRDIGRYPTTGEGLAALVQRPQNVRNWNGPYLFFDEVRIPEDPWGQKYHYKSPGQHGEYDLYSLGADNAEGGDGENADIVSWTKDDGRSHQSTTEERRTPQDSSPAQPGVNAQTAALQTKVEGEADLPGAAPLGAPSTAASPAESADIPGVNVGDTYVVESQYPQNAKLNNTTERKVISVVDGEITVTSRNVSSTTGRSRILRFTPEWNLVSSRNADGSGLDYSPPLKYFEFPLYPGKTWRQTSIEKNIKTGATREFTLSATVGDWKNVSVPAGTFRAIKITTQTALLDGTTGQRSTGTDISWYAPEIRRSVKSLVPSRNMQGNAEEQFIHMVRYELK